MPQKKKARSLVSLCVNNIIQNIAFWHQKSFDDPENNLGPFNGIPTTLLKLLMDEVNSKLELTVTKDDDLSPVRINSTAVETLRDQNLISSMKIFFVENLESCALKHHRQFQPKDFYQFLKLIGSKCTQMKSLEISNWKLKPYSDEILTNLVPNLSKLQFLDVHRCNCCRDQGLKLLAKYCPDLRCLILNGCPVTNVGIAALCGISSNAVDELDSIGCKQIRKLNICGTQVTEKGIQMALLHLPNLTFLRHDSTVPVILKMEQAGQLQMGRPKFPLTFLSYSAKPGHRKDILSKALQYVDLSSITKVVFSIDSEMSSTADERILPLTGLIHLRELSLFSCPPKTLSPFPGPVVEHGITFMGGTQPILEAVGQSLEMLILTNMAVNLKAVAKFCPHLKEIGLNHCNPISSSAFPAASQHFQHLEKIGILGNDQTGLTSEDYIFLFSSPGLIEITVTICYHLDDRVFERTKALHSFLHLEKLTLRYCTLISRRSIALLLNPETPLRKIWLENSSIKSADIEGWKRKAKEDNWDVVFM